VNFSWGHQHLGISVDEQGVIRRYDRSGNPWENEAVRRGDSRLTESDLHSKTAGSEVVGRISAADVAEKMLLVPRSALGTIERTHTVFDAGGTTCMAYLYDVTEPTLQTIVLGGHGEFRTTNSAPEAGVLQDWSRHVAPIRPRE